MTNTVNGITYYGKVDLSYELLEVPVFSPCNVSNVDPKKLIITWSPVPGASAYELEIENEALGVEIEMELGPEITQISLPPEMLRPNSEYEIGLAVENELGNIIVSECVFETGKI